MQHENIYDSPRQDMLFEKQISLSFLTGGFLEVPAECRQCELSHLIVAERIICHSCHAIGQDDAYCHEH